MYGFPLTRFLAWQTGPESPPLTRTRRPHSRAHPAATCTLVPRNRPPAAACGLGRPRDPPWLWPVPTERLCGRHSPSPLQNPEGSGHDSCGLEIVGGSALGGLSSRDSRWEHLPESPAPVVVTVPQESAVVAPSGTRGPRRERAEADIPPTAAGDSCRPGGGGWGQKQACGGPGCCRHPPCGSRRVRSLSLWLAFLTWTAGSWGSTGPFRDRGASSRVGGGSLDL